MKACWYSATHGLCCCLPFAFHKCILRVILTVLLCIASSTQVKGPRKQQQCARKQGSRDDFGSGFSPGWVLYAFVLVCYVTWCQHAHQGGAIVHDALHLFVINQMECVLPGPLDIIKGPCAEVCNHPETVRVTKLQFNGVPPLPSPNNFILL